jgi:hypothetical protein
MGERVKWEAWEGGYNADFTWPVLARVAPLPDGGWLCVIRDVTEGGRVLDVAAYGCASERAAKRRARQEWAKRKAAREAGG